MAAPSINVVLTKSADGITPLLVNVDCTGTTCASRTTRPYHDLTYKIDFGDPSGPAWTNGVAGSNPNVHWGPIGSHVYALTQAGSGIGFSDSAFTITVKVWNDLFEFSTHQTNFTVRSFSGGATTHVRRFVCKTTLVAAPLDANDGKDMYGFNLSGATFTAATKRLVKIGAFAAYADPGGVGNDNPDVAIDYIAITGGTAVTPRLVRIVDKISNDEVELQVDITTNASNPTDVTSSNGPWLTWTKMTTDMEDPADGVINRVSFEANQTWSASETATLTPNGAGSGAMIVDTCGSSAVKPIITKPTAQNSLVVLNEKANVRFRSLNFTGTGSTDGIDDLASNVLFYKCTFTNWQDAWQANNGSAAGVIFSNLGCVDCLYSTLTAYNAVLNGQNTPLKVNLWCMLSNTFATPAANGLVRGECKKGQFSYNVCPAHPGASAFDFRDKHNDGTFNEFIQVSDNDNNQGTATVGATVNLSQGGGLPANYHRNIIVERNHQYGAPASAPQNGLLETGGSTSSQFYDITVRNNICRESQLLISTFSGGTMDHWRVYGNLYRRTLFATASCWGFKGRVTNLLLESNIFDLPNQTSNFKFIEQETHATEDMQAHTTERSNIIYRPLHGNSLVSIEGGTLKTIIPGSPPSGTWIDAGKSNLSKSTEPTYVDSGANNYRPLNSSSPQVNIGQASLIPGFNLDKDNLKRPSGPTADSGPFELGGADIETGSGQVFPTPAIVEFHAIAPTVTGGAASVTATPAIMQFVAVAAQVSNSTAPASTIFSHGSPLGLGGIH